ncbi:unnamed protein product [Owenia fusiformis]|uniref:Innexin n=1 Tax=Owenia fusiformis TaxID=6347 RepID=A0A8J1XU18_OWEFU|nr:unnamed protein product [Owenia fusiformis]
MLLEALEILKSTDDDVTAHVTDFSVYKVVYILTVYVPVVMATLMLSQEYLGSKIACFAPESFSDSQSEALNEYCWTNGYWIANDTAMERSLYTQPHRFYPYYLPLQAILFVIPILVWNVMTKSRLLAIIKATEQFLEDLLELLNPKQEEKETDEEVEKMHIKVKEMIGHYHQITLEFARDSKLSVILCVRLCIELGFLLLCIGGQFFIYDHRNKVYHCSLPSMGQDEVLCVVPVLDLLDIIWTINFGALCIALGLNFLFIAMTYYSIHQETVVDLYEGLPFTFDMPKVQWEDIFMKHSYELMCVIFEENNNITMQAYILRTIKPPDAMMFKSPANSETTGSTLNLTFETSDFKPDAAGFKTNQDSEHINTTSDVYNVDNCQKNPDTELIRYESDNVKLIDFQNNNESNQLKQFDDRDEDDQSICSKSSNNSELVLTEKITVFPKVNSEPNSPTENGPVRKRTIQESDV